MTETIDLLKKTIEIAECCQKEIVPLWTFYGFVWGISNKKLKKELKKEEPEFVSLVEEYISKGFEKYDKNKKIVCSKCKENVDITKKFCANCGEKIKSS